MVFSGLHKELTSELGFAGFVGVYLADERGKGFGRPLSQSRELGWTWAWFSAALGRPVFTSTRDRVAEN